jgi:hypothetical protein
MDLCEDCFKAHCENTSTKQSNKTRKQNANKKNSSFFVPLTLEKNQESLIEGSKIIENGNIETLIIGLKHEVHEALSVIKTVQNKRNKKIY